MSGTLIVQCPKSRPDLLVLLFHGVGASAEDLIPLGSHLASALPNAFIVSVDGSEASDFGSSRQWFSVRGVTEANRADRVRATMPNFIAPIRLWQAKSAVDASRTVLVGFSQGAIMALDAGAFRTKIG